MNTKKLSNLELCKNAAELFNEYQYIQQITPYIISELKKRDLPERLKDEYGDVESICEELESLIY